MPPHTVDGYETGGLDVTRRPYRLLDRQGRAHERRFAFGVPTEGVHWVTAAGGAARGGLGAAVRLGRGGAGGAAAGGGAGTVAGEGTGHRRRPAAAGRPRRPGCANGTDLKVPRTART
ncbi:hypothetical protein GCM10020295_58810 [Streptomyces cinereospinus]